jgi:hypothetical protein
MRRVPLDDGARGGVLGLAAVLTATSYPTRTSPSARGKFVLEALLGAPPPPPPPGVGVLADTRARAERRPACASASSAPFRPVVRRRATRGIDPIGFRPREPGSGRALGASRDGSHAVDARGTLPGRTAPSPGPAGAASGLIADDPAFVRCLVERLAVYALGRGSSCRRIRPGSTAAIARSRPRTDAGRADRGDRAVARLRAR